MSGAARVGRGHGGGHRQFGQGFYAAGFAAGRVVEPERQERGRLDGRAGAGQNGRGAFADRGLAGVDG